MQVMNKLSFKGGYAELCIQFIKYKRNLGYDYGFRQCYAVKYMNDYLSKCYNGKIYLTKKMVEKYIEKQTGEAKSTQNKRMYMIRQFAIFLDSLNYESFILPYNKKKNTKTFVPYIFTKKQITSLIKAADQLKYIKQAPYSYLVYPMLIRLLYSCGLRISEALRLKINDIDLEKGILTIEQAKFNNSRLIPMSNSLLDYIKKYIKKMETPINYKGYIFPSTRNEVYSSRSVYKRYRYLLKQANIEHGGRGNGPRLHDIRHTFCVHALEQMVIKGMDIYCALPILSTYMGHRTIESTEKYLRLTPSSYTNIINSLESLYENVFPRGVKNEQT